MKTGLWTENGENIYIGGTYYGRVTGAEFKILGVDGRRLIIKNESGSYTYIFSESLRSYPPKPNGFEAEYIGYLRAHENAVIFDAGTISSELMETIDKLSGHKIKITVEVL